MANNYETVNKEVRHLQNVLQNVMTEVKDLLQCIDRKTLTFKQRDRIRAAIFDHIMEAIQALSDITGTAQEDITEDFIYCQTHQAKPTEKTPQNVNQEVKGLVDLTPYTIDRLRADLIKFCD